MAKRQSKHGDKSTAIRAILAEQPTASMKDIQAALAAKRLSVSIALISKVKASERHGGKLPSNGRHSNGKSERVSFHHLLAAKQFASQVGGLEAARSAINSLAKLMG